MAVSRSKNNVAYGIGNPLVTLPPDPISSRRSPTQSDFAQLGTIWTCKTNDCAWVLVAIIQNKAHWTPITVNAGARVLSGDVVVTEDIYGRTIHATGDSGSGIPGHVGITGIIDTDVSTGRLWIKSKTHLSSSNDGFFKMYVDGDVVWIPYFSNIAPGMEAHSIPDPFVKL